jgi:hypothetical protein
MVLDDYLTPLALQMGIIGLVAQCILVLAFMFVLPEGPWTRMPGYTAHQAVCLPFMIYLVVEGVKGWCFPSDEMKALEGLAYDRVMSEHPIGTRLADVVTGMLLLWDLPSTFATRDLWDPLMILHHIGMVFIAHAMVNIIGGYYATCFLGFIELSTLPLCIADVFHPKNKPWFEYIKTSKILMAINEVVRVAFAVLFLTIRAIYFPYVVFCWVIPDLLHVASLDDTDRPPHTTPVKLYAIIASAVLFSCLQIHWGSLVLKQALKIFVPPNDKPKAE